MWIVMLLLAVALLAGVLLWVDRTRKSIAPAPLFVVNEGEFRRQAQSNGCLDQGTAELTLGNGTQTQWAPPSFGLDCHGDAGWRESEPGKITAPNEDWRETLLVAAPGILGAAAFGDVVHSSLLLDDSLLEALSQLSRTQVDGLASFRNAMEANYYQLDSVKIRGTVGEQVSGENFEKAGYSVEFPEASNNPGWDFKLDGSPVNVKVTQNFENVAADHYAENPDIPIVVNADAANIPANALHFDESALDPAELIGENIVIIDESLTLASIEDITDAGSDAVDGLDVDDGGLIPGLSFIIAGVSSGYRERKLVNSGKSDWQRALKNVGIDTAIKGGGAFAGFIAGAASGLAIDAAAGGILVGIPTFAGGSAGSTAGSRAGGKVASTVRLRPLKKAQKGLQKRLSDYGSAARESQDHAETSIQLAVDREDGRLRTSADAAQMVFEEALMDLRLRLTQSTVLTEDETRRLLEGAAGVVESEERRYEKYVADLGAVARRLALPQLTAMHDSAEAWRKRAGFIESLDEDSARLAEEAFDLVIGLPGGQAAAGAFFTRIAQTRILVRQGAREANTRMVATITAMRAQSVQVVGRDRETAISEAQAKMLPEIRAIERARKLVIRELEMAGRA